MRYVRVSMNIELECREEGLPIEHAAHVLHVLLMTDGRPHVVPDNGHEVARVLRLS